MSCKVIAIPALAFFFCLLVHAVLWRVKYPKNRPVALISIFVLLPFAAGAAWALLSSYGILPGPGFGTEEWLAAALLQLAFASAYIMTYPAFEALSPSLAIVLLVGSSNGMKKEELRFFSDRELLEPRIKDLLDSGLVEAHGNALAITAKGRLLAGFFVFMRAFLGLGKGRG